MKLFSEIIVLYDDKAMPEEDKFCPSFWQAERFDSDGDFYWDGLSACWTNLKLSKLYEGGEQSDFELNIYRERYRKFEPSIVEVEDLARYISYKSEGRYALKERINNAKNLCVASFFITTKRADDYLEYLKTVHFFLEYTDGIAANLYGFDAKTFSEEFL